MQIIKTYTFESFASEKTENIGEREREREREREQNKSLSKLKPNLSSWTSSSLKNFQKISKIFQNSLNLSQAGSNHKPYLSERISKYK